MGRYEPEGLCRYVKARLATCLIRGKRPSGVAPRELTWSLALTMQHRGTRLNSQRTAARTHATYSSCRESMRRAPSHLVSHRRCTLIHRASHAAGPPLTRRMNWLEPPAEPPEAGDTGAPVPPQDPLRPSESNLNYWAARLTPLHDPTPGYGAALAGSGPQDAAQMPNPGAAGAGKEVVFVACNRIGTEEGKCSIVLRQDMQGLGLIIAQAQPLSARRAS